MWDLWLGVQPRDMAVPRRKVEVPVWVVTAGIVGALLATDRHEWWTWLLVGATAGAPIGWASRRWPRWAYSGGRRQTIVSAICVPVVGVLLFAIDTGGAGRDWWLMGLAVFGVLQIPAALRTADVQPAGPGWFADPAGRFPWRGWNRLAWTDEVVLADGQRTTDPQGAPETLAANAPGRIPPPGRASSSVGPAGIEPTTEAL